jgi:ABC-type transporter Mla subunit MlaD
MSATVSTIGRLIGRSGPPLTVVANEELTLDDLAANVDRAKINVEQAFEMLEQCQTAAKSAQDVFAEAESALVAALQNHLVTFEMVKKAGMS